MESNDVSAAEISPRCLTDPMILILPHLPLSIYMTQHPFAVLVLHDLLYFAFSRVY
jgi:hypothetical protein